MGRGLGREVRRHPPLGFSCGIFAQSVFDPRAMSKAIVADSDLLNVKQVMYEGRTCYRLDETFPGAGVEACRLSTLTETSSFCGKKATTITQAEEVEKS